MIALTEELLATAKQNEIPLSDAGATPESPDLLEGAWQKMVCLFLLSHLFSLSFYLKMRLRDYFSQFFLAELM